MEVVWKPRSPNTSSATSSSCDRRRAAGKRGECGRTDIDRSVRRQRRKDTDPGLGTTYAVRPSKQTQAFTARRARTRVGSGKGVSVRVDIGGSHIMKKTINDKT